MLAVLATPVRSLAILFPSAIAVLRLKIHTNLTENSWSIRRFTATKADCTFKTFMLANDELRPEFSVLRGGSESCRYDADDDGVTAIEVE
jgi:hypothetical protein